MKEFLPKQTTLWVPEPQRLIMPTVPLLRPIALVYEQFKDPEAQLELNILEEEFGIPWAERAEYLIRTIGHKLVALAKKCIEEPISWNSFQFDDCREMMLAAKEKTNRDKWRGNLQMLSDIGGPYITACLTKLILLEIPELKENPAGSNKQPDFVLREFSYEGLPRRTKESRNTPCLQRNEKKEDGPSNVTDGLEQKVGAIAPHMAHNGLHLRTLWKVKNDFIEITDMLLSWFKLSDHDAPSANNSKSTTIKVNPTRAQWFSLYHPIQEGLFELPIS